VSLALVQTNSTIRTKEKKKQMVKFFNWFFFFISIGSLTAVTVLVYIQDRVGRGICVCTIVVGLCVFLLGTKRYRFKKLVGSPLTQIAAVYVAAWRKRNLDLPSDSSLFNLDDIEDEIFYVLIVLFNGSMFLGAKFTYLIQLM